MPAERIKCLDVNINKHQDRTQGLEDTEQGSAQASLAGHELQALKAEVQRLCPPEWWAGLGRAFWASNHSVSQLGAPPDTHRYRQGLLDFPPGTGV